MLRLYVNDTDITQNVDLGSVKISSTLGNRRNTASFSVHDIDISEAQRVEIFKGYGLSQDISSGVSSFAVDLEDNDSCLANLSHFLRPGDRIIVGNRTANAEKVTVDHVTDDTIYISGVTSRSHTRVDAVGVRIFAGLTLKNPREEIGRSEMMTYSVDASDYSTLLDAENVVDTYENQNAREILSRVVYLFTATDEAMTINACESVAGISTSGVAVTPTLDSVDKVYQNQSINIGASGSGTGKYIFSFSAMDLSDMNIARLWIKSPASPESYLSEMTFSIVDSSGNSYKWTANLGGGGWGYDSGRFEDAVVSGSMDPSNIVKFEIELVAVHAVSIGTFKVDHILATKGGFTLKNTQKGNVVFSDVRSQYKKPTVFIEELAKENGFFWYVDTEKDIHFFSSEENPSPESLSDTSENFNALKISADITNIRNRQTIRGGMAPDDNIYEQTKVMDGKESSYRLDYPPKTLRIYISDDDGVTWSEKSVGVENLVDETTVDFVFNFSEKTVRNAAIAIIPATHLLKFEYFPYKDIRVQWRDQTSIDRMRGLLGGSGVYDGPVINDTSIRSFQDARNRAKAELRAYSNPILTASFDTERDGLQVGQTITISSTKYNIDAGFVIQKITATQKDIYGGFIYKVTCGSTLYGLTEFFQYLLKNTAKGEIDVNELVDVVTTIDETLIIGDSLSSRKLSSTDPWYIHSRTGQYNHTLTLTEGGTPRDAYLDFFLVA